MESLILEFGKWLLEDWVINPSTGLPIAAGVLLICKKSGRLLPNMRGRSVAAGNTVSTWGGALDEGETPEKAVEREVREETGYGGNIELIPSFIFRNEKYEYHNFIGLVENEFKPMLNWESNSMNWMTWEELNEMSHKWHPAFKSFINNSKSHIEKLLAPSGGKS